MITQDIIPVVGVLVTILLSGNIFFIKRLIDKIDLTSNACKTCELEISKLIGIVGAIGEQLRELKSDLRELRQMEIDVAVLRSERKPSKTKPHNV